MRAMVSKNISNNKCTIVVSVLVVAGVVAGLIAVVVVLQNYESWDTDASSDQQIKDRQSIPASNTRTTSKITTSSLPSTTTTPAADDIPNLERIDCFPEVLGGVETVDNEKCMKRGCIFLNSATPGIPSCFFPKQDFGYEVTGRETNRLGYQLTLRRQGGFPFEGTPNIETIVFRVEELGDNLLRFRVDDPSRQRYEVPVPLSLPNERARNPAYEVVVTNEDPFSFQIIRRSTKTVIWDTGVGGFVFSDQFIQISTKLPSKNVYGFGENLHKSFRHDLNHKTWPMFSRDQPPRWKEQSSLYGVHPFYQCVENDGNTHGVFLLNSNAQEYGFTPLPMLTYRTLGGILDFYIFMGPKPEDVVMQYTNVVGRPIMPPYWALGFQLCRYGYNKLENLQAAVERTRAAGIPHDVQYADIDHMEEQKDFTISSERFAGLPEYFNELQSKGMKTIIILDPTLISNETNYNPYEQMKKIDGNIKWPPGFKVPPDSQDSKGALLGYVWPNGKVVFPDFFKKDTNDVWRKLITDHHVVLSFDGLWIDMNEPANFGTNEERPWNWPEEARPYWSLKCGNNSLDEPPYRPMAAFVHDDRGNSIKKPLADKTICMNSVQGEGGMYRHYDVHSLYGWSQTESTLEAVKEVTGKRGIVITRSTFAGSGKFAGHWLGDNNSDWPDLHHSIIGMLEFNLFGIPYIGADICGFWNNVTVEMCKRWMQLGAFYTFSRNHNGKGYIDQDPGALGAEVVNAAREALETRYWLLPYLYTLFHNAHAHGHTVIRPLHHEFPWDERALQIDRQFLWGPALLISPILEQGQTRLSLYLPDGKWYDFYTGASLEGEKDLELAIESDTKIPLHVRGGFILPMQKPANNTFFSRKNPMSLLVALNKDASARGEMMWDDGEEIETYESGNNFYTQFIGKRNSVEMSIKWRQNVPEIDNLYFDMIKVFGVEEVSHVYVNDGGIGHGNFTYDNITQVLKIYDLYLPLAMDFKVTWVSGRKVNEAEAMRVDCLPDIVDEDERLQASTECQIRGCVWSLSSDLKQVPPCYFQSTMGYQLTRTEQIDKGQRFTLQKLGLQSMFKGDISTITLTVQMYSNDLLRFTFDADNSAQPSTKRYRVPIELNLPDVPVEEPRYEFVDSTPSTPGSSAFSFKIVRKSTGTSIWDTSVGGLVFDEQFLQIATRLPSRNIYGFGENRHSSFRHDLFFKRWGLFSRDQPPGWGEGNLYGVHPFYTCVEDENNAHGVLLLNSNAQDYSFSPLPMLTYRTIGGILDFFVFMGPHPENVVQQYTQLIGRPMMPPYWSLGFQLCRYGYNHIDNLRGAVERTRAAGIPLDVQYADIDHMDERKDFTVDSVAFPNLNQYFKSLQESGMRIIIILDPALIANETGYAPYDEMFAQDANIKWPQFYDNNTAFVPPENSSDAKGALLGYVWPKGKTVFPDFFKNATKQVWKDLIVHHYNNNLTFDGLWIDMNEPANFGTNEERPFNWPEKDRPYWSLKCQGNKWDEPPYKTMATYAHGKAATLPSKTICMIAEQGDGEVYRHYDVHSLYGWSQTLPTLEALQTATGERGIVISRSTFPGSGKYAGHWLGDNDSQWSHMADSIIGMLEFNLFGIPYIGADICGFFGDTTSEMCLRWMQLGAFYTFSRNHNGFDGIDQDPKALGEDVAEASRVAMTTRYWLLPYLYTLFHYANAKGNTVIRPLHHEFIWDTETYGIDRQFLWGPALLISPILEQGQKELSMYLPVKSRWYDFYTGQIASEWGGHSVELDIEADTKIPLHLRGGYILPMQEPANTTHFSRMKPFKLRAALHAWSSGGGKAEGELFWDDGISIDTMNNYYYTKFFASEMMVEMKVQQNASVVDGLYINTIEVYGVDVYVNNVYVKVHDPMRDEMMQKHETFTYDSGKKVLIITDLQLALNMDFSVEWWNRDMPSMEETYRIDCLPDGQKVENHMSACLQRGCIWNTDTTANNVPACFIDTTNYGYKVKSVPVQENSAQTVMDLEKVHFQGYSMFGEDRDVITFTVDLLSDDVIHFKFTDPSDPGRYEVPVPIDASRMPLTQNRQYGFNYTNEGVFSFNIYRRSTGTVLFDTSMGGLTFASQFLQLVAKLPSSNVYGFGENRHFSFRHNMYYKEWPMFARDQGVGHNDYGNLYGTHPFFTCLEDQRGNSFGVFLRNSNAQEVSLLPTPAVNWRTIGGILDFYLFLGPSPENVIQQYTQLIGRPFLPPYWSLGFQLCRYGYNSLDNLKAAYQRTIDAKIPLDIQYADIDHMDERMDFTIDPVNFAGLPEFVSSIQQDGMRFIIILDPALITNVTGYQPYEKGLVEDVFIKWPPGKSPDFAEYGNNNMLGYVWPKGKTVFPDFFNNKTHTYWQSLIRDWHMNLTFDGLWIDMNEPANFATNEERPPNWPAKDKPYWSLKCANNQWDDPPYKPRSLTGDRMSDWTICMATEQNGGMYRHYDVHSLYGWSQTEPTLRGLQMATNKRGIVISRSTFPGSGKHGGHWLGDNDSVWPHMKDSIVGMLEFNLFGIPYIGADICGFARDTTKEMCQRWMQVGAFYPFARNHNAIGQKEQDPGFLGREVAEVSRRVMEIRYWLLPYLYTAFYKAHTTGSTVVRSLMHQYPTDPNTWDIDTQFLWGGDFMIAPIVYEAKISRTVYFPNDVWYDFHTGEKVWAMGQYWTVNAPMDHIPLFVRGGSILPGQQSANNTYYSRQNPMQLLVALDNSGNSHGELYWDDGEAIDSSASMFLASFTCERTVNIYQLASNIQIRSRNTGLTINQIKILGLDTRPSQVLNNGATSLNFRYYPTTKLLVIDELSLSVDSDLQIEVQLPG